MLTKKMIILWIASCLLLAGCAAPQTGSEGNEALSDSRESEVIEESEETGESEAIEGSEETGESEAIEGSEAMVESEETEEAEAIEESEAIEEPETEEEEFRTIAPLPDSTMDNLTDATLNISLEEGDAYVDDSGIMQMDLKIYTYDKYDMVDIAELKVGDTIVRHSGEVKVVSKEQSDTGTIYINGGLDAEGFDLVTDDCGIFYETGFSDVKNWYEVGEATIRVSADFIGTDKADPEKGEVVIYPGDFLVGAVTNYHFTPHNTTIRVEDGQIVEMNRVYTP